MEQQVRNSSRMTAYKTCGRHLSLANQNQKMCLNFSDLVDFETGNLAIKNSYFTPKFLIIIILY